MSSDSKMGKLEWILGLGALAIGAYLVYTWIKGKAPSVDVTAGGMTTTTPWIAPGPAFGGETTVVPFDTLGLINWVLGRLGVGPSSVGKSERELAGGILPSEAAGFAQQAAASEAAGNPWAPTVTPIAPSINTEARTAYENRETPLKWRYIPQ